MKKIILLFIGIIFTHLAYSQETVIEEVGREISIWGEAKILIPMDKVYDINILANTISLDYSKGGNWLGYVNKKQYNRFLDLNIEHSLFEGENSAKALTMAKTMDEMSNWDCYPVYEVYDSIMRRFAEDYPSVCKLDTIGFSNKNRLILGLRISTNPHQDIDKPKFCYSSTMHGDELLGYVLMLRLSDWLLSNYESDQRARDIIDNTQVFINPLANPDGTYAGGNASIRYSTRYNYNHVDLNRNFPCPINGPHPDSEDWQAETIAFMNYADSNEFSISANIHSGAEVLNYPYDIYTSNQRSHVDANWFIDICQSFIDSIPSSAPSTFFRDVSHSGYINGGDWYRIPGGRQDYHTYFKYGREITFEISSIKLLGTDKLNNYWNYLRGSLISYIETCQRGIEGYVRDSATNEPIRARIWIENHDDYNSEVYSKSTTGYYYRPILGGNYSVSYSAEGYKTKKIQDIQINNTSLINQDVFLAKAGIGLEEIEADKGFDIYPIPSKDKINLYIRNYLGEKKTYSVKTALGIEIIRGNIIDKTTNIDISKLSSGIYFISLGDKAIKFIK